MARNPSPSDNAPKTATALEAAFIAYEAANAGRAKASKGQAKKLNAATGDLNVALAAHAAANLSYTAEDFLNRRYGADNVETWTGRTLIQRRSDVNAVIEASRKAPQTVTAELWEVAGSGAKWTQLCRFIVGKPDATSEDIEAEKKRVADKADTMNDGDKAYRALFLDLGTIEDTDTFNRFKPHLAAMMVEYKKMRAENKLRTTKENDKAERDAKAGRKASGPSIEERLAA